MDILSRKRFRSGKCVELLRNIASLLMERDGKGVLEKDRL